MKKRTAYAHTVGTPAGDTCGLPWRRKLVQPRPAVERLPGGVSHLRLRSIVRTARALFMRCQHEFLCAGEGEGAS